MIQVYIWYCVNGIEEHLQESVHNTKNTQLYYFDAMCHFPEIVFHVSVCAVI